jgi:hypothetical protein
VKLCCRTRRKPLSTAHGHISQKLGRSTFDTPTDRDFGKPAYFALWFRFIAFNGEDCQKNDVSSSSCKNCRCHEGAMGKAKRCDRRQINAKERRTHSSRTEEAFPIDESPVGSEEESSRKEIKHDLA